MMKNNAEIYFEEQMKNPEFRVHYSFAREKYKLEFMLEKLIENINSDFEKTKLLKQAKKIEKYVSKICLM